jgi:hypothetical protein
MATDDQRNIEVVDGEQKQLNDISHHSEPSREMAHCTDKCRAEKLKNLVVERGNNAEHVIGQLDPPWIHYGAQDLLSNDDKHHLSDGKQRHEVRCHIKLPSLKALPVGQGRMGELLTVREKQDLELMVVEERGAVTENRDLELVVKEKELCSENQNTACSMQSH